MFRTSPGTVPTFYPSCSEARHGVIVRLLVGLSSKFISGRRVLGRLRCVRKLSVASGYAGCRLGDAVCSLIFGCFGSRYTRFIIARAALISRHGALFAVSGDSFVGTTVNALGYTCCIVRSRRSRGRCLSTGLLSRICRTRLPNRFVIVNNECCRILFVDTSENIIIGHTTSDVRSHRCCERLERCGVSSFRYSGGVNSEGAVKGVIVRHNFTSFSIRARNCVLVDSCNSLGRSFERRVDGVPNEDCGSGGILGVALPRADRGVEAAIYVLLGRIFGAACPSGYGCIYTMAGVSRSVGLVPKVTCATRYRSNDSGYVCVLRSDVLSLNLVSSIREGLGHFFRVVASFLG